MIWDVLRNIGLRYKDLYQRIEKMMMIMMMRIEDG